MVQDPPRVDHPLQRATDGLRPGGSLSLADERRIMKAWEDFVSGHRQTVVTVPKQLLSSWERSARAGVGPTSRLAPIVTQGADEVHALRSSNRDLIWASRGLLMSSGHLLANSGSLMLLTDPNGVILEAVGDVRTRELGQENHLMEGGKWQEDVIGTNAIGTALAMRQPVQVHASEHFCEGIKRWTCAAAPVFYPDSDILLGAVDISGPPGTYQLNNLVLAVSAARQIEVALAERLGREHFQLMEAAMRYAGRSETQALLVLDTAGTLIHASGNPPGPARLRLGARVPGFRLGDHFQEWARHLPEGLRPEWLHTVNFDGRAIGALLVVPRAQGRVGAAALTGLAAVSPPLGAPPRGSASAPAPESASELDIGRSAFGGLLGQSKALLATIQQARLLSTRRVAVLLQGETGVGKELFARAIHGDEAHGGPFITFNCGATTKELIGSELFGHVRGAFTGATHEGRAGRFELAHGGTLCLDEIGELPLDLQPVLLRALEEGVVYRLGEAKPRRVDVRLLAMTNRNLLAEVEAGRFRRDLYHRIGVTRVRVPPLRERGGDIPLLAAHFNQTLAARHGVASRSFGPAVLQALQAYDWPGNVRELRNVIESLLLMSVAPEVQRDELPEEILAAPPLPPGGEAPAAAAPSGGSLEEAERGAIIQAIHAHHGNLAQTARALRISRSTLYRKVERYHLEHIVHLGDEPQPEEPER